MFVSWASLKTQIANFVVVAGSYFDIHFKLKFHFLCGIVELFIPPPPQRKRGTLARSSEGLGMVCVCVCLDDIF